MDTGTLEVLAPVLVMVSGSGLTGFVVWVVLTNRRRSNIVKAQTEMQTRLLEKFGTSQEMLQYLQSDAGKKFLESATIEQTTPYGRILGSASVGVILSMLGLALLLVRGQVAGAEAGFVVSGTLSLALGVGFLLSAALAYALSKVWGLINGTSKPSGLH